MSTRIVVRRFLSAILLLASFSFAGGGWPSSVFRPANAEAAPPEWYAGNFISTAAIGVAMNDAGDMTGTSYPDLGCGSFCLPPLETVVWRGIERIVLPSIPGLTGIYVDGINNQGWVSGYAGYPNTTNHAVVWRPSGNTYVATDLGTLPGTTSSYAVGIDELGRVVGWSTTLNFPYNGSPFMWSESTGMVDLSTLGYPDEPPLAISRGGAVATVSTWYKLGDPGSVVSMPSPPRGYVIGNEPTAINDAGDQARFLISTGSQNLRYLFRFHKEGTWQQISFTGNGNLSRYGVGSINDAGDLTATVLSSAVIAYGPDGLTQPLAPLLSPAYQGSEVTSAGPMNNGGEILAQVMIGRGQRLMRLTPAQSCANGCIRVNNLVIRAKFVQDPNFPGECFEGGRMFNAARVRLQVTDENGAPLKGVLVTGRFLDDYWTNAPVSGQTNKSGVVTFPYRGLCGVGAIAFLVDSATLGPRVFDRTVGMLTGWTIPH